jgi:hypothetical protein
MNKIFNNSLSNPSDSAWPNTWKDINWKDVNARVNEAQQTIYINYATL